MVRSKEVTKKPKDPLMTPPSSKARGFRDDGYGGGRSWSRGGAAMSPAPASVPNYMRATSSSGAKGGRPAQPPSSASPARGRPVRVVPRGKVLFPKVVTGLGQATCSSTMKDAKFPDALDLAPGATDAAGPAALRVCPYTYCSLNGHVHAPAVPLRSFLSSRRRLIKTQQRMKHKGVSAFRRSTAHQRPEDKTGAGAAAKAAPLVGEEALGDFFVEVYTGPRVSTDMSCSDMSLDEMDATVRKMEFVVFDRCGADEDSEKGGDLGVCGDDDGDGCGDGDGRLKKRFDASSSECSDAAMSGEFVEDLPWMRYQGYEYDSFDGEVSEERDEEIVAACVSEQQEGEGEEGTPGRLGDECEKVVQDQEANDEEDTPDLAHETEMVAEKQGVDCRVEVCDCEEKEGMGEDNILLSLREVSTEEEQNLAAVCKLEIPEQAVEETVDNVLDESCKEDYTSAEREEEGDGTNMESAISEVTEETNVEDGEKKISEESVSGFGCKEDLSEDVTSEAISNSEGQIEDFSKEVTSEAASDSKGQISDFSAIGSPDVEIQEPVENRSFEQDDSTVDNAFAQDDSTADRAFDQHDIIADGHDDGQKELGIRMSEFDVASEEAGISQGTNQDDTVNGTKDAHEEFDTALCNLQDASEYCGIAQEDSQDGNSACFYDGAQMVPEITTCKLDDTSNESGVTQESSGSSAYVEDGVQMEPEIITCKLDDTSEESDTAQETIRDDNSACPKDCAQLELGIVTSELEGTTEEACIAQEIGQDDNSEYVRGDDPQNNSGTTASKLEISSEEHVIAQETDDYSPDVSNESQHATCESADSSEVFDVTQETIQDENTADCIDGSRKEVASEDYVAQEADISEHTTCELADASEEFVVTQETVQDDNTAVLSDGAEKESRIITSESDITREGDQEDYTACESADASEEFVVTQETVQDDNTAVMSDGAEKECGIITSESDITREGDQEDYTAGVNAGAQEELKTNACESGDASDGPAVSKEADAHVNTADLSDISQKEIATSTLDDCEVLCMTEETDHSCDVEILELNCNFPNTEDHGDPKNQGTVAKESSTDDICNALSGMNLKGNVYLDPTESATCPGNRLIIARRRTALEEEEYMRGFNPRAPNLLPLELDPEAEKVDLRHQMLDDRKNAEEYLIDYALRRAVNNLAPARKKKVELLVQAFETVLPHDEDDITPTRPVQACN